MNTLNGKRTRNNNAQSGAPDAPSLDPRFVTLKTPAATNQRPENVINKAEIKEGGIRDSSFARISVLAIVSTFKSEASPSQLKLAFLTWLIHLDLGRGGRSRWKWLEA